MTVQSSDTSMPKCKTIVVQLPFFLCQSRHGDLPSTPNPTLVMPVELGMYVTELLRE